MTEWGWHEDPLDYFTEVRDAGGVYPYANMQFRRDYFREETILFRLAALCMNCEDETILPLEGAG